MTWWTKINQVNKKETAIRDKRAIARRAARKGTTLLSFLLILFPLSAQSGPPAISPAAAGPAVIRVTVLCREPGVLRVDLVDESTFGNPGRPLARREVPVGAGGLAEPVTVSFEGLAPGRYAVRAFLDIDGNGRLNGGVLGPAEPWALSWAAGPRRGIPRFQDIAFSAAGEVFEIHMEVKR